MAKERSELKSAGYEIFIGILSILSIVNLVLGYTVVEDVALQEVLTVMNGLFSLIFFGDFIFRLTTAPSKGAYFFKHFGWTDLLSSLPLPELKLLRLFRVVMVFRELRAGGPRPVWVALVKDRAGSALIVLLLMGIFVLEFGSLTILNIEQYAPGSNITTASDAIWYTIVTISTVGYGDRYPVTDLGRVGGTVIIIIGVGIFGTFTGYLANLFLSPSSEEPDAAASRVPSENTATVMSEATVTQLRAMIARSEADLGVMKSLIDGSAGTAIDTPESR